MATFGQNLKRIQTAQDLSVTELARRVGVAQSVVSGWRTDRRGLPETPTLFKLAKALNCAIEDLLKDVDEEYSRLRFHRVLETVEKSLLERKLLERVKCGIEDGFVELSDVEKVLYPRLTDVLSQLETLAIQKHGPKSKDTSPWVIGLSMTDDDALHVARAVELSLELLRRLNSRLPDDYDPDASLTAAQRADQRDKAETLDKALEWMKLNRAGGGGNPERTRKRIAADKTLPSHVRRTLEEMLDLVEAMSRKEGRSNRG